MMTEPDESIWQQWSDKDWGNWLSNRLIERKNVFGGDPDELIGSYNREIAHASSYQGRELLELIQNADDSGEGYNRPNKMLIELTSDALYVANTGVPFSPKGIKSLMVSDNSPKHAEGSKYIGYKGLGFRSILGWSKSISIVSGNLSIGFSKAIAVDWLKQFSQGNERVREKIEEKAGEGFVNPIPILSIPSLLKLDKDKTNFSSIINKMFELRGHGFDTVVCLELDKTDKVLEKVLEQIKNIGPEILLFLKHLDQLSIVSPEKQAQWKVSRKENEVSINLENGQKQLWRLFFESDDIPLKYRKTEQPSACKYEITLATASSEVTTNRLFVYFPTEVLFPFPIIAHATLELTDNRQHLIETDVNKFIIERLAKIMAKLAEGSVDQRNPWNALLKVTARGDIDPVLSELGFRDRLKQEVLCRKIIPVRSGLFETAQNTKRIEQDFDDLLVGEQFKDIVLFTEDEQLLAELEALDVTVLEHKDFMQRISGASKAGLTIELRAEIIYRLINDGIIDWWRRDQTVPQLLVDEAVSAIPLGTKAFLPPEGKPFLLPEWFSLKILNSGLCRLLREKFNVTNRDLASKLGPFEVREYNLVSIVPSLINETNVLCAKRPNDEPKTRNEVLKIIWAFFLAKSQEEARFPEGTDVTIPTRDNHFTSARKTYFGKEYPSGKLLEGLYGPIGGPFVAGPSELVLSENLEEVESFLRWIGVADTPRTVTVNLYRHDNDSFFDYVLDHLKYPAQFEDTWPHSKDEVKSMYPRLEAVNTIDRLDEILAKADPYAIIAWISKSNELLTTWRTYGDKNATLKISPPYKVNSRRLSTQTVTSYPLWLIQNTCWIPVGNGQKQRPVLCTFAKGLSGEVSIVIGYPAFDINNPLLKEQKIDKITLKNSLITAGVVTEIDDLSWDAFYSILLSLPNLDSQGKVAKSIYRVLIGRSDNEIPQGKKYEEFISNGLMWGRQGESFGYFPLKALYYFDNTTLPESMLEVLPSLELDRKKGSAKVKRLFGVNSFSLSATNIRITEFDLHPYWESFQAEIERIKPYIYALRVEEDSDCSELRLLQRLQVRLCRSVKCSLKAGESETELLLKSGESIPEDSIIYLVAEEFDIEKQIMKDEIVADALGDVITSLLKVEVGSDIARLATCSNPRLDGLLDKITGGSGKARLEKVEERMKIGFLKDDEFEATPRFVSAPINTQPTAESTMPEVAGETESGDTEQTSEPPEVGPVKITGGEAIKPSKSHKISYRVKVNTNLTDISYQRGPSVDPDRAEDIAIEFEKTQGRFPEKVGHLQGLQAFGCDILSFNTEANRTLFYKTQTTSLISRFIEVKGRVSNTGSIQLKGNELISARSNKAKFFLYRIYESGNSGDFELVETQDPLGIETDAIKVQYEINQFKSKCSKRWEVKITKEETDPVEADTD